MEKLALLGGQPAKTQPFPDWPQYDQHEEKALMDVLHSTVWWRTPGTKTLQFEQDFAKYHQVKYGVACTNGTAALEIAMAALDIGLGDEVIVPDFTFVATASAVLTAGALPVMVDVDPETFNIRPDLVEKAITPRTKAIICVHVAGMPCDMEQLLEIARKHKLLLVEDSAHAHGSEWKGQKVGSLGACGTFSFQASKLMTAGEGGIIVTNNPDLEVRLRSVHDCGRMPGEWFYSHFINGSNYRLSEWQGAVLIEQLKRLDDQAAKRTPNALYLDGELVKIEGIRPQKRDESGYPQRKLLLHFPLRSLKLRRIEVGKIHRSLECRRHPYAGQLPSSAQAGSLSEWRVSQTIIARGRQRDHDFLGKDFPVTDDAAENTIWLVHRTLLGTEQDTAEIVEAVKKIQRNARN